MIYDDHFGNGQSDRPEDFADLTMDRLVSDADALRGLALIDTTPALDYEPALSGNDEQVGALGALFGGPMPDDETFRATWNLVIQMYFKDFDPAVGAKLDEATTYSHQAWSTAAGLLGGFNMTEALPDVNTPVWAVAGRADGITPPDHGAGRIADLSPNASLTVYENSAHYPFIEEEDAFFSDLRNWISGL